jgi:hypothetical protein
MQPWFLQKPAGRHEGLHGAVIMSLYNDTTNGASLSVPLCLCQGTSGTVLNNNTISGELVLIGSTCEVPWSVPQHRYLCHRTATIP